MTYAFRALETARTATSTYLYDTIRYMAGPFVMWTVRGRLAAAVAYSVS